MNFLVFFVVNYSLLGSKSQGDPAQFSEARSLAMGGVISVLDEPSSFSKNVAALGLISNVAISLSLRGLFYNERHSLRVYDEYNNNMGLATIFDNSVQDYVLNQAGLVLPWKNVRLGLTYRPEWDFGYKSYAEVRNEFYQLITTEQTISAGAINNFKQGLALSFSSLKFGLGHSYFFGKRDFHYEKYDYTTQHRETDNYQNKFNGGGFDFGTLFSYDIHLRSGFAISLPYSIKFGNSQYDYPAQCRLGLLYQPPLMIPSKIVCEIEIYAWNIVDSTLNNIYSLHFGFEHKAGKDYYLRYGFCLAPDYRNDEIYLTGLSFGLGWALEPIAIDFGYGFSRKNFLARDFNELNFLRPQNLHIEETTHTFLLTLSSKR